MAARRSFRVRRLTSGSKGMQVYAAMGPWLGGILADHTSTAAPLAWTAALCAAAAVLAAAPARPGLARATCPGEPPTHNHAEH